MRTHIILIFTCATTFLAECHLQYEQAVPNYAEIRHVLDQYKKKIARKYGRFNDFEADVKSLSEVPKDDGTEVTTNRKTGVASDLFENDILLTLPQAEALLSETNRRGARQAQTESRYFWQKRNISYAFVGNEVVWRDLIRSALKHLENETCFRFKENGGDKDFLAYYRGSGCWSSVGRIGGKQHISIGYGCENKGIIAHETLHALGLWHEQSRSDRDEVVEIRYHNIVKNLEYNFEKRTTSNSDNLGQPYDLGSVMHYGPSAFTNSYDKYTIIAKDQNYQNTMGQRAGISFKDAKMINTRYCSDICNKPLNCAYGGYTDPNDCSKCRCPPGFGGKTCNDVQPSRSSNCGGELTAIDTYRSLKNPPMESDLHCVWRIKSNSPQIEVVVDAIDMPCSTSCETFLEMKYKNDYVPTGPRFCCLPSGNTFFSDTNLFVLIFVTKPNNDNRFTGFKLRYRAYSDLPDSTFVKLKATTLKPTENNTLEEIGDKNREKTTTKNYLYLKSLKTERPSTKAPIIWTTKRKMTLTPSFTARPAKHTTRFISTVTQAPFSVAASYWSEWGGWSTCSTSCGGCGIRARVRACYGGNRRCSGKNREEEPCGLERCSYDVKNTVKCHGRLTFPCELIEKLHFDIDEGKDVRYLPAEKVLKKKFISENYYKRKSSEKVLLSSSLGSEDTELCSKRFTFSCPAQAVSINIDWKKSNLHVPEVQVDTRGCCHGYYFNGHICAKD